MKVLVTGGGGIIGSALITELRAQGHTPYCVDIDPITYNQVNAEECWCHNICDAGRTVKLMSDLKFDVVVHLAEVNYIDPIAQVSAFMTNVGGTAEILYWCALLNIRCVVGTWGVLDKPFSPIATSLNMRRHLIGIYSNGNAVINEVRIPIILHPDFPSSNFRAFANRVFNTIQLGQPFMVDQAELHTLPFRFCKVKLVVDAIVETIQLRTRNAVEVAMMDSKNHATLHQLITLCLDVFGAEELTIYGRDDPYTIKAMSPRNNKSKINIHNWIKEEWNGFI